MPKQFSGKARFTMCPSDSCRKSDDAVAHGHAPRRSGGRGVSSSSSSILSGLGTIRAGMKRRRCRRRRRKKKSTSEQVITPREQDTSEQRSRTQQNLQNNYWDSLKFAAFSTIEYFYCIRGTTSYSFPGTTTH